MAKNHRLKWLAAAGFSLAISSSAALATGGDWYDELPPQKLHDTLDMLPAKSFGQIFTETAPPKSAAKAPDFTAEITKIAARLGQEPGAKLVPAVDELLAAVREHYGKDGKEICNLLHDVRDVLAGSAGDAAAAREYIQWRLENRALIGGRTDEQQAADAATLEKLDKRAEAATGPLKAHWLYLCGAARFAAGERVESREWFERVVTEFPDHPRAEAALFMTGRCALSASRQDSMEDDERQKAQAKAAGIFRRYMDKYRAGRFATDAQGWLGALAYDRGDYTKALEYYIAQAETPGHPEILKSALFMCETSLAHLMPKPEGDAAFELVARHPAIAMGFTYYVLAAPEADNYDGQFDKSADVRKWRRTMLPRIAAAVAKQKDGYKSGDWQPRYLAMLAQAASAEGKQEQALQLTETAPERDDDLLFARGLALQRMGRAHDAATVFGKFLELFPKSPLAAGVKLRYALALQDDHRAGEALARLKQLMGPPEENHYYRGIDSRYTQIGEYPQDLIDWDTGSSAVYPNFSGVDENQVAGVIDLILNFAPLPEIAAGLEGDGFSDAEKNGIRGVIAERYLAQEDFANAKKYMSPEQFNAIAAGLEKLTAAANAAKTPKEKAAAMLRTGDAWAAARDKLLPIPLNTNVPFYGHPIYDALERRENGRAFGCADMDTILEDRDELRHASRWWMRAARTLPATPLAAEARWKALEAMPRIAEASAFAETRAREINGEAVSRELYARLRSECPGSVEATRYATYWSFPKPAKPKQPGAENTDNADNADSEDSSQENPYAERDGRKLGYKYPDIGAFNEEQGSSGSDQYDKDITDRVPALRKNAGEWEPAKMASEVRVLAAKGRKSFTTIEEASCMNMLDDLALFYTEHSITKEMQKIYVNARLDLLHRTIWAGDAPADPGISTQDSDEAVAEEIRHALANPAMKPVADYLEFCLIGLAAGTHTDVDTGHKQMDKGEDTSITYQSRDYAAMEKMARDFLQKYPRSKKREAAMFVLARSVHSLSRPYVFEMWEHPPGVPPGGNFITVIKSHQAEPLDVKRVLKPLDDYDREFPKGRYSADIRNLRANVLWRTRQWKPALELTIVQLKDSAHGDLQYEAAMRLTNLFAQLAETKNRADILQAIKETPAAIPLLKNYLSCAGPRSHPLHYLTAYLSDQLK